MPYMRFSRLLSIFILSFISFYVAAQDKGGVASRPVPDIGSVSGKVVDVQGSPIAYVTVTLLRMDSTVVNGDLTKDDGTFSVAPTGIGKFMLRMESIGVITKYVSVEITTASPNKDLGKIKLSATENTLKSVDIVGERPVMELKVDKKVFNVEKNITTAGGSAADVLANVPSVTVDADGNVSLRGKTAVTILIDGKPATMLGTDVASALQSMPAGSIDNIEVITNPSAKYDASGTSGIINIVTKKDGRFGMNGNATLGAGTRDKYNGNFGINAHKGKWNVFANASFRLNSSFNDVTTKRYKKNSLDTVKQIFDTYENVPRHGNGSFNSIGATYDPDKYNSLTVTQGINIMHFGYKDYSNYDVYDNPISSVPSFHQYKYTDFYVDLFSLSSSLDYKHKFKKKDEELTFDFTYSHTAINRHQYYSAQDTIQTIQNSPATGTNSNITISADYTDPLFTKNGKLGLGFKSQTNPFTSNGDPKIAIGSSPLATDKELIANYNFTNQINAAYANWSDLVNKFSYQAGIRVEQNKYNGSGQIPRDTSFHTSFNNLFPSAFVSYQLPNQQSIYLNYSRRTNYPDFRSLLPFKDFSNPGTVNTGNPNLIPEFSNNLEFSYSKATTRGDNFILSAYYTQTLNLIQKITRPIDSGDAAIGLQQEVGELYTRPVNIKEGITYGIEGTGHIQIVKWWDATVNANFFQNNLTIGNIDTADRRYVSNNGGFAWFGKINTSVKFPKGFTLQVNGNYESSKVVAQGKLGATGWVDVALRKNLWKNKANIVLNCSDIFKTHRFITEYNQPAFYETIDRVKETRIGTLTFTYRFGKSDSAKKTGSKKEKTKSMMEPTDKDRENNLREGDDNDQGGGGMGQKQSGSKN